MDVLRRFGPAVAVASSCLVVQAQVANGFDLSQTLIPAEEIRQGGPPRDGIVALIDPPRWTSEEADRWLEDEDGVLGLVLGGQAVAYPIRILNWHELVNDRVGGRPVCVTYCPLTGTGVVFEASLSGQRALFGVSGLLYNSNLLFYDRATESLFSQLMLRAVSGPLRGTALEPLPAVATTWARWRERYPQSAVLSPALPYGLDYGTDPYAFYRRSGATMFPVRGKDRSRHAKAWAYLVLGQDRSWIAAREDLEGASLRREPRSWQGEGFSLVYDPASGELSVPEARAVIPGYWFALTAFYPQASRITRERLEEGVRAPR